MLLIHFWYFRAETSAESTEDTKAYQESNPPEPPAPPPTEPEIPPPSVPPDDEIPQKARRVIADEDSESDKESNSQKRLQRIEILQVTEAPQLIEPSEVIVSSGAIYETAEPVLTPVGKYYFHILYFDALMSYNSTVNFFCSSLL